jgi:hypothetical protein
MDQLIATGLAGLSTFVWGLAAATLWIVRRRAPRLSLAMAGVSMVVFLVCASAIPPGYDEAEVRRIEALHAGFAPVLEQYRRQHGTYPSTLEQAGITTPQTRYGPIRYHVHRTVDGRPWYELSFGDYFDNGFVRFWHNDDGEGEWYTDM